MDAAEKALKLRVFAAEGRAHRRGFHREAHLDVGRRKSFAREPRMFDELALPKIHMCYELRIDKQLLHTAGDLLQNWAHEKGRPLFRKLAED